MGFVIRIIVTGFALWVVTLFSFFEVSVRPFGDGGPLMTALTLLVVAAIFGIVNAVVGTIIRVVAFPLYLLTLGLISFIVNGFLLWLTGVLTSSFHWGLEVDNFWTAILAAIVISIITAIFGAIVRPQRKKSRD